jgi:RimJ/RimL family protein N-acetyltransferase
MPLALLRVSATAGADGLSLRGWCDGDAGPLIEIYRDPALRRRTKILIDDRRDAQRWLDRQRRGSMLGERLSFAVDEISSATGRPRLVANVVLKLGGLADGHAEVGYWTAAPARGRGIAPRAVEALSRWAAGAYAADGLRRLELLHDLDNLASCRVAIKAGYLDHEVVPAPTPATDGGHRHVRPLTTFTS